MLTVVGFLLYFACRTSLYVSSSNQPAYWTPAALVPPPPVWSKCSGEIVLRAHHSLLRVFIFFVKMSQWDCAQCTFKTSHTPQRCRIVQDQPQCDDSSLLYDFPEKLVLTFWIISMLLFPLHLVGLQILRPVLTRVIWGQHIPLLLF